MTAYRRKCQPGRGTATMCRPAPPSARRRPGSHAPDGREALRRHSRRAAFRVRLMVHRRSSSCSRSTPRRPTRSYTALRIAASARAVWSTGRAGTGRSGPTCRRNGTMTALIALPSSRADHGPAATSDPIHPHPLRPVFDVASDPPAPQRHLRHPHRYQRRAPT